MDRLRPPYPDEDLYSSGIFGSLALVERYLGSESLEKSLPKAGITRVLDVGCGWSFTNLKQLARLNDAGKPIFEPNDLLA
ncbi:MAG TPA: hypothetical protein VK338_00865, partial [Candidatus Nitrosocosmicus sp.]|nr:hypothetical protein [Candidatus Nitrosocosmicus sp.]